MSVSKVLLAIEAICLAMVVTICLAWYTGERAELEPIVVILLVVGTNVMHIFRRRLAESHLRKELRQEKEALADWLGEKLDKVFVDALEKSDARSTDDLRRLLADMVPSTTESLLEQWKTSEPIADLSTVAPVDGTGQKRKRSMKEAYGIDSAKENVTSLSPEEVKLWRFRRK